MTEARKLVVEHGLLGLTRLARGLVWSVVPVFPTTYEAEYALDYDKPEPSGKSLRRYIGRDLTKAGVVMSACGVDRLEAEALLVEAAEWRQQQQAFAEQCALNAKDAPPPQNFDEGALTL